MYLSLDIGEKKTGIAVSDESMTIANPKKVVETSELKKELQKLFDVNKYKGIVIGHSTDFSGKDNEIMKKVYSVKTKIEKMLANTNTKIYLHQEIYIHYIYKGSVPDFHLLFLQNLLLISLPYLYFII